ncbi:hypothetical protein AKJ44_01965 [candidate division MSBL1 archaeon SCGC-AAA261F17]|uniref:Amidohydrolase-related domain-containing protein n=1 Tax=candidate division MSBL1 archaeon SCGC-AAA261F17 TaxID=1698274 RepID=A0A133V667_9EURY|nr:hypothetical protein AKJ44_01965 [candidate division MSBL1 archaeon SCGC-AAA261F17]
MMMAEKVFSNGTILAGEELEAVKGYLTVRDGVVNEIGEGQPPKRGIDLHRGFIIPPFVNAHTHLADSVIKDIYAGRKQEDVVGARSEKFVALNSSSEEAKIKAIESSLHDMIRTGTSAHCDFRESGKAGIHLMRKAKESGVKSILLSRPEKQDEVKDLLTISDGIGLPSLNSFSDEEIRKISALTAKAKKFFSIHVAEVRNAQKSSIENTGKTEIQRALDFDPSFLIHGTWASDEDLTLMKKKGVPLVICGRANHLLSVGAPPLNQALEKGVEIWIGTDNVTACQPDMFCELSFDWALLRKNNSQVGSEEARALLKSATVNSSRGLRLPFGALEKGNKAVFTILGRKNNLINLKDPYVGIVNRARADNIRMVFCPDGGVRKFYK